MFYLLYEWRPNTQQEWAKGHNGFGSYAAADTLRSELLGNPNYRKVSNVLTDAKP